MRNMKKEGGSTSFPWIPPEKNPPRRQFQPPGSASPAHAANPPMAAPNVATRPYASGLPGLPGRRKVAG